MRLQSLHFGSARQGLSALALVLILASVSAGASHAPALAADAAGVPAPGRLEKLRSDEAELAELVRRASDRPEAMLAELQKRWPADLGAAPERSLAWQFAKAQVLLAGGQTEGVEQLAALIDKRGDAGEHAWLLRALLQERQSRPAGALAARALAGLAPQCPRGDELRAVAAGCPFRATWFALRIIDRDQSSQGAHVAAEASLRYALALAQAAGDKYLSAMSHAQLALVLQAQDKLDASHLELQAGLADAQGDWRASARVRNAEAVVAQRAGDVPASRAAMVAAVKLAELGDAPLMLAQFRANLVDVLMRQGDLPQAISVGQRALPVLQQFSNRAFERVLRHNLAVAHIKLKQFDAARRELAHVAEFGNDPAQLVPRARELRELDEAWGEAGQYKEALAAFHAERELEARAVERNREAALEELRRKYDSGAKQRDLDLLARDSAVKDQQLANRKLAQQVGVAVGVLLLLSLVLAGVTLVRSRRAQRNLQVNQVLLRTQSERDPLTDLSNRRHFLSVMEPHGSGEFHGALMMIDIDHFKNVNDWHGHAAGDAVIVEVSRRISQAVRVSDLVVRWGGEEFLVFAPELAHADLSHLVERVLQGIGAAPVATDEGPLRITASIGFASFPVGAALHLNWEQAVNWADTVLYKAKAEGRNRAVGIVGVQLQSAAAPGELLQDFDAACQRGEVELTTQLGPE